MSTVPFVFDPDAHSYTCPRTGQIFPSITKLLDKAGFYEKAYFTEESRLRGTAVHEFAAHWDIHSSGTCDARYGGWCAAYGKFVTDVQPSWTDIERASVHPRFKFAGTIDRAGWVYEMRTIAELKTGQPSKADAIQTAMQAILIEGDGGLPARNYQRIAIYLRENGTYQVVPFTDQRDFIEAYKIIKEQIT